MILKLHLITFFAVQTIYKKRWSVRLLSYSSSFRRTLHNLIRQNHIELWGNISKDQVMSNFSSYRRSNMIIYKKTDEWHIEWQWMTTNANEWQRMTTSDNKCQSVTASDSSGTTNEYSTVHFKEWMIAILSMTKTDTLLLQSMDG